MVDEIVLPDDVIKKIVRHIRMIHNVSEIELALRKAKFHVKPSLLRKKKSLISLSGGL